MEPLASRHLYGAVSRIAATHLDTIRIVPTYAAMTGGWGS